ncbi:hypothetical protein ACMBCN_02710, partial [Candidatus Liberibacter asiaticus]|nr:hypothetical protein [Candidatus Liberibacter asiaticus]
MLCLNSTSMSINSSMMKLEREYVYRMKKLLRIIFFIYLLNFNFFWLFLLVHVDYKLFIYLFLCTSHKSSMMTFTLVVR